MYGESFVIEVVFVVGLGNTQLQKQLVQRPGLVLCGEFRSDPGIPCRRATGRVDEYAVVLLCERFPEKLGTRSFGES